MNGYLYAGAAKAGRKQAAGGGQDETLQEPPLHKDIIGDIVIESGKKEKKYNDININGGPCNINARDFHD